MRRVLFTFALLMFLTGGVSRGYSADQKQAPAPPSQPQAAPVPGTMMGPQMMQGQGMMGPGGMMPGMMAPGIFGPGGKQGQPMMARGGMMPMMSMMPYGSPCMMPYGMG